MGERSATPTTSSSRTEMGSRVERPSGTVTTPTAPASDTSTMRDRVTAQIDKTCSDPVVGARLAVAPEVTGTSSRGARDHAAVNARTVTPWLVRVNRWLIDTPRTPAKGGLVAQPRRAHSGDWVLL